MQKSDVIKGGKGKKWELLYPFPDPRYAFEILSDRFVCSDSKWWRGRNQGKVDNRAVPIATPSGS